MNFKNLGLFLSLFCFTIAPYNCYAGKDEKENDSLTHRQIKRVRFDLEAKGEPDKNVKRKESGNITPLLPSIKSLLLQQLPSAQETPNDACATLVGTSPSIPSHSFPARLSSYNPQKHNAPTKELIHKAYFTGRLTELEMGALFLNKRTQALSLFNCGKDKFALGDHQGALDAYSAALKMEELDDINKARCLNCRGVVKAFLGDHQEALEDYTQALNMNKLEGIFKATCLQNRGVVKAFLGDHQGALEDMTQALEMDVLKDVDKVRCLFYCGEIKVILGRNKEARIDFGKALAIPDCPDDQAEKIVKELKQLFPQVGLQIAL